MHSANPSSRRTWLALAAVAVLLAANVVVPAMWGDVYPFTSAPMFRDNPAQYCNYRVWSPEGVELPAEDWGLARVYDGNPVGYGVGLVPPVAIEQEFGIVHDEGTVRRHVERQFARGTNARHSYVEVQQEVIGPVDARRVGVVRTTRWRITRPLEGEAPNHKHQILNKSK